MRFRRRRLDARVDAVLDGKPLPSGAMTNPDDAEILRTAIELRAARPQADLPSEAFIARLRRRVDAEGAGTDVGRGPSAVVGRRALLAGAGAVAAAAAGAVADRTLLESASRPAARADASAALVPDRGAWVAIGPRSSLGAASPQRFATARAVGFVSEQNGDVVAVSGACTHLGCLLQPNPDGERLDCPCHRTSFALNGKVLFSQLDTAPAPLPTVAARVRADTIEVYLPADS